MSRIIEYVDIEASEWVNPFVVGRLMENNEVLYYEGENCIIEYLNAIIETAKKLKKVIQIFAHNGGKYDFLFFLECLKQNKIENIEFVLKGDNSGRLVELKIYDNQNKLLVIFMDSYRLLHTSLKKISKGLQLKHKKQGNLIYDISKIKRQYQKHPFIVKEYLKYDLLSLKEGVKVFREVTGSKKNTIGAVAKEKLFQYANYDRTAFENSIQKFETPNQNAFLRQGYYGGRVELFQNKSKNTFIYDVNSLYPYVMSTHLYPLGRGEYLNTANPEKWRKTLGGVFAVYDVDIEVFENFITPLPVRYKNKIYFPYGILKNYIIDEYTLKLYEKRGVLKVKKYNNVIFYKHLIDFSLFVKHFYNLKQKNDSHSLIYKFLLNSSYGKFAENYKDITYKSNLIDDKICSGIYDEQTDMYRYERDKIFFTNHLAIALTITNLARYYLYNFMIKFQNNLLYVDTDSLHLDKKIIGGELKIDNKIGNFKLEHRGKNAIYLSSKLYRFYDRDLKKVIIKSKGFNLLKNLSNIYNGVLIKDRLTLYKKIMITGEFKTYNTLKLKRIGYETKQKINNFYYSLPIDRVLKL